MRFPLGGDTDGDGMPNCNEVAGYSVSVVSAGSLDSGSNAAVPVTAYGDYKNPDTDGDGLSDGEEWTSLDSRVDRADSDGDGLDDGEELATYASRPLNADSDGDAAVPNATGQYSPDLYDGAEAGWQSVTNYLGDTVPVGTSPVSPDTDGDAGCGDTCAAGATFGDYDEIVNYSAATKNPVVANLPSFSTGLGSGAGTPAETINIYVPYTVTTTTGTQNQTASATQTQTTTSTTNQENASLQLQFSEAYEASSEVGFPSDEAAISVRYGAQQTIGAGWTGTQASSSSSQSTYSTYEQTSSTQATTLGTQGCAIANIAFTNTSSSPIGFTIQSPEVTALIPDDDDPTELEPFFVLEAQTPTSVNCPSISATPSVTLAPGGTQTVPMVAQIDAQQVVDYLANPVPITYQTSYTGLVDTATNVDYLQTVIPDVDAQTAAVSVDFGDGTSMLAYVAANVTKDGNAAAGVALDTALRGPMMGLAPTYAGGSSGDADLQSLTEPGGRVVATADGCTPPSDTNPTPTGDCNDGMWAIAGQVDGITGDPATAADVPSLVLDPADAVAIAYLADDDNDGLPNQQEQGTGTNPAAQDTDTDGLADKVETLSGIIVPVPASGGTAQNTRVYSSPLLCDADGDNSPDGPGSGTGGGDYSDCPDPQGPPTGSYVEATRACASSCPPPTDGGPATTYGTDPTNADTNADGLLDGEEAYPAVLAYTPQGGRAPEFVTQYGGSGSGNGTFDGPTSVAVYQTAGSVPGPPQVLVADGGNDLLQLLQVTLPATGGVQPISFSAQVGVPNQVQGCDGVYGVAATPTAATTPAVAFTSDAARLGTTTLGVAGSGSGAATASFLNGGSSYFQPAESFECDSGDVAFDPSGNIYVAWADEGSFDGSNVPAPTQYSSSGSSIRTFGSIATDATTCPVNAGNPDQSGGSPAPTGQLANPAGIALDAADDVYVADDQEGPSSAINAFSNTGQIESCLSLGTTQMNDPQGVGVDADGYIYVLDDGGTVFKFSESLTLLQTFGGDGDGNGLFDSPSDLASDASSNLYVADTGNDQIQLLGYPLGQGNG